MNSMRWVFAFILALGLLGGCGRKVKGPPPPPTFSVTGEISDAGGKPLPGILIQFIAESNPSLNISAPIKDGKFKLKTSFGNQTVTGTMEGRYRVKVIPRFDGPVPVEVILPDICEIKAQENHFVLKLPR
jgi:hypothetical protein